MSNEAAPIADEVYYSTENLTVGRHVRLRCNCQGFISGISKEPFDRWLEVTYTSDGCNKTGDLKNEYAISSFSKKDVFRAESFPLVLPMTVTKPPEWFKSLEDGPKVTVNSMVAVSIRSEDGMETANFVIPASLCSGNVHHMATMLRSLGDRVEVKVVHHKGWLEEGKPIADGMVREFPSQDGLQRDMDCLTDWILSEIAKGPPGIEIRYDADVPVPKEGVKKVLEHIVKESGRWKRNAIRISTSDGMVASAMSDGKIL